MKTRNDQLVTARSSVDVSVLLCVSMCVCVCVCERVPWTLCGPAMTGKSGDSLAAEQLDGDCAEEHWDALLMEEMQIYQSS